MSDLLQSGHVASATGTSDSISEAIAWFMEFIRQTPSLDRWNEFEEWLSADPQNEHHFIALERLWKNAESGEERVKPTRSQKTRRIHERESAGSSRAGSSLAGSYGAATETSPTQPRKYMPGCLTLGNSARSAAMSFIVNEQEAAAYGEDALVATFLTAGKGSATAVAHLSRVDLIPVRKAIDAALRVNDPRQWAALHMILGAALRLQALALPVPQRTAACVESLCAFETALGEYWERKAYRFLRKSKGEAIHIPVKARGSAVQQNGVQMVMEAATASFSQSSELLESAIQVFTDAAATAHRSKQTREWVVARSNLACALTLLGQRTNGIEGASLIEHAVVILREAAAACAGDDLVQERSFIYVNLSEAFQGLAKRAMPDERLRYMEIALEWIAEALKTFAPEEYRWLLELERATLA